MLAVRNCRVKASAHVMVRLFVSMMTDNPSTQRFRSTVSRASLQKAGVLLKPAGDFREFWSQKFELRVSGDRTMSKKPAIGGPFLFVERIFSKKHTDWLARECRSHLSPANFPANRELYREIYDFEASGNTWKLEITKPQRRFRDNSLIKLTGKIILRTGSFC